MLMKRLAAAIVLMVGQVTNADCTTILSLCDKEVQNCRNLVTQQSTQINNYKQNDGLQKQIIADKDKQLSSPLRDPVKVAAGTTMLILVLEIVTGHIK